MVRHNTGKSVYSGKKVRLLKSAKTVVSAITVVACSIYNVATKIERLKSKTSSDCPVELQPRRGELK